MKKLKMIWIVLRYYPNKTGLLKNVSDNKKLDLSDWLLASDIDGTLNNKARNLVMRNYDMIQRFINEYGGNFTLASGRSPESMRKHFKRLDIADGKAIVLNGAGIYDYAEEKIDGMKETYETVHRKYLFQRIRRLRSSARFSSVEC